MYLCGRMYSGLLYFHSLFRWLVLILLLGAVFRAAHGLWKQRTFGKSDNLLRHWTATAGHVQLIIGILLYINSPVIRFFFSETKQAMQHRETTFFSLIHSGLMLLAMVVLTVGSAMAKRRTSDSEKFKTMLWWFLTTLLILIIAIPWPFSPLANRPYIR